MLRDIDQPQCQNIKKKKSLWEIKKIITCDIIVNQCHVILTSQYHLSATDIDISKMSIFAYQ